MCMIEVIAIATIVILLFILIVYKKLSTQIGVMESILRIHTNKIPTVPTEHFKVVPYKDTFILFGIDTEVYKKYTSFITKKGGEEFLENYLKNMNSKS